MCFSVINQASYDNAESKWSPEIRKHSAHTPVILCGTKIDMRKDSRTLQSLQAKGASPISKEQGEQLAKRIGAIKYVECSAKTREGLKEVFDEAILAAFVSFCFFHFFQPLILFPNSLYPPSTKKAAKCTIL